MGHNVDLGMFGMCSIRCKNCGKDLELDDVDIDCDLKTHHPMTFELSLTCNKCESENSFIFSIKEERD